MVAVSLCNMAMSMRCYLAMSMRCYLAMSMRCYLAMSMRRLQVSVMSTMILAAEL